MLFIGQLLSCTLDNENDLFTKNALKECVRDFIINKRLINILFEFNSSQIIGTIKSLDYNDGKVFCEFEIYDETIIDFIKNNKFYCVPGGHMVKREEIFNICVIDEFNLISVGLTTNPLDISLKQVTAKDENLEIIFEESI